MTIVTMTGRMVKDPEIKRYKNSDGQERGMLVFSLADSRKGKDPIFMDCTAFGATGKLIAQYCKKGAQLAVCGELSAKIVESNDGHKRTYWNLSVSSVQFLGGSKDEKTGNSDLPF